MIGVFIAKKAIANSFEALNQHDLSKFMSAWRDDGAYVYPGETPQSGTFKGKAAVEGWFRKYFDQFPKIQFEIQNICFENIFDLTGTNVAAVYWYLQLTNRDGRIGKFSGVTVIDIKGGKAILAKDFIFDLGENFKLIWEAV
jgi:ketosteroid isomerase-like protein